MVHHLGDEYAPRFSTSAAISRIHLPEVAIINTWNSTTPTFLKRRRT